MNNLGVADVVPPLFPVALQSPVQSVAVRLSLQLRARTASSHQQVEQKLGLPDSIATLADYATCLARFSTLYRPLEALLLRFSNWPSTGFDVHQGLLTVRLASDLGMLGVIGHEIANAPKACLPLLPDFAHALGALYVIEGSALGSQFILPQLRTVLGKGMDGADTFFLGRGDGTMVFWRGFQASLDQYGVDQPAQIESVIDGANATFEVVGSWMKP